MGQYGSASITDEGFEALQMVAATYCMRSYLRINLITMPAAIESEALARQRLVVAKQWLSQNGVARDTITLSQEERTATDDPGIMCKVTFQPDKPLREFFWLLAHGESRTDAGTKETKEIATWLEENFVCC